MTQKVIGQSISVDRLAELSWSLHLSNSLTVCSLNWLSLPCTVLLCGQTDMSLYSRALLVWEKSERVEVQTDK